MEIKNFELRNKINNKIKIFIEDLNRFCNNKKNQGKYDLICFSHSLEHFQNPDKILKNIQKLLKNEGFCYIIIPNFKSIFSNFFKKYWGWLQPSVHFCHFYPKGLIQLCKKNNLKLSYYSSQGGDSLFLLLTIFNVLKKNINFKVNFYKKSYLKEIMLKFFSNIFKYIYYIGNDESLFLFKKK